MRGIQTAALIHMIVVSGGLAQPGPDPATPVLRAIVEAEEAIRRNEPQIAESRFRTALLEGWLLLGALAVAENDLVAARSAYEAATTVAVETRRARLSLAAIHLGTGDPGEAIFLLRMVISEDLKDLQARRLLSQALAANGQLGESVQELEELRVLFPEDLEILYLLGAAYLRQQKLEAAEPLFDELADRNPTPQTQVLIGRTYRDFDHFGPARETLEAALEMDPKVRRAHYYLGTVEVFERGQGGLAAAMAHFAAELEVNPDDPMTNLYLGMALVEERREEEAIPKLEVASRHPATERDALQYLGTAYLRAGRATEAVGALERALELAALSPLEVADDSLLNVQLAQISKLHYQLGLALRRSGDETAATVHFKAAEESKARETEDSRERLRRFLEDEPRERPHEVFGSPLETARVAGLDARERTELRARVTRRLAQVCLNLGVLQAQAQHLSRAGDLFEQAAALDPEFPQVQYSLGVARFNSGQFEQATEPLSRALENDPANAQLRRMLALAWLNSERYDEAAELLGPDPDRADDRNLQYAYGLALVRSGRAAEAEASFTELLTRHQDWPELNVVLGHAFAQQDDYERAIESLKKAIELQPDVAEAHLTLGEIYMRQGRLEEAEAELRAELRHHPEDLRARYVLATVLDLARRSEEAMEVLQTLLEKSPRAANARYLLGKILLAEGKAEQAEIQLEAAVGLAPADAETHYQLGLALQRQGRPEEARREFEIYQSLKRSQRAGES